MANGDRFEKEIEVFEGGRLFNDIPPIHLNKTPRCHFFGKDQSGRPSQVGLDDDLLSKHLLFLGGIGTGKTTAMYQLIKQIRDGMTTDDVMVVFDTKGDFRKRFFRPGDVVISNDDYAIGPNGTKDFWNLFNEIETDEHMEENLVEIARTIFYDKLQSTKEPFFPNAAKDLFLAILYYFCDTDTDEDGNPVGHSNEDIRSYLDQATIAELLKTLKDYPDLFQAFTSYIETEGTPQSQGVFSELQQVVREVFLGNFRKDGTLSIRDLVRKKQGKIIFIEYDLAIGNTLTPIYRLLFDLAIKEALSRQDEEELIQGTKSNVFFVADEFRLLPHLQHIDNAVNFGRSLGVKFIIGLQNVEQLYASYGQLRASSILSGFSTRICFRLNDNVSRTYIKGTFGKNRKIESYLSTVQSRGLHESVRDANVIEDWDITHLKTGEAIIGIPEHEPFFFKFDNYTG